MKSLKTAVQKFWQETLFSILLGVFLLDMLVHYQKWFEKTLDIFIVCVHVVILLFLILQFFLKNKVLSNLLSTSLIVYSLVWILFSFAIPIENIYHRIPIIIFAIFLLFTAITMLIKYYQINVFRTLTE